MDTTIYKQLEQDALLWVNEASSILTSQEHTFTIAKKKDAVDVATSGDIEVEKYLTKKILEKYPDHGVCGEELESINENAEYQWIIDPLDGTKDYVRGNGEYNILLAVEQNKTLVTGVIKRFGHFIIYICSRGNGSYCDGNRIHVSTVQSIEKSSIGTNFIKNQFHTSSEIDSYLSIYKKLVLNTYRVRPYWDDSRLFSLVAQGSFDASVCLPNATKWHDIAPALLLVEEAGGKVTNWEGNPLKNHDVSKGILVSNGMLHEQLLKIVKEGL